VREEVPAAPRAAEPGGVEPDSILATPSDEAVVVGQGLDGRVTDLGARSEEVFNVSDFETDW